MSPTRPTAAASSTGTAPTDTAPVRAAAVRARSAVEAADSVDLVWDDGSCTVTDGVAALPGGGVAWDVAEGSALHARLCRAAVEDSDLGVCAAVTDVAPLAVRGRVRGQLALAGWLQVGPATGAHDAFRVRLAPEEVVWHEPGTSPRHLAAGLYRDSRPDPLAACEADLLLGLRREPRLEAALVDLARRCPGVGAAERVTPLRLESTGLVLRVVLPRGARDVRLRFAQPATTVALAWAGLERLVS